GALVLAGTAAGTAAGLYVAAYAVLRFGLEELRGDPGRRYWRGLSEAQWTSLALVALELGLAAGGVLPALQVPLGAAVLLAGGVVWV
ncbi:prolipoprotein diacylglyceryl transferase family protein, partial [Idiomarina sp. ST10R2A5]|uniref:prolipoprotein diacylglyceryl transferase family protein n=1 Tax=Idiomarina sp. ST10R2A5 TaxID=3418368 RepID=UPI003EC727AF